MIENSLLWSIEDGQSKTSYLFGTMHVCDDIAYTHTDKALNALIKCRAFRTEIDLDSAKTDIKVTDYFFLNRETLRDHTTEHHYLKSKRIIAKVFNMNLDQLARLLPIILVNKLMESELGKDNPLPLDSYLWQQASNYKMHMGGLETVEEQVTTLRSLEVREQVRVFRKLTSNVAKFKKSTKKMIALYAREDIQELYARSAKGLGKFRKPLLFKRNELMADRIGYNLGQATFYAVGAAHLAGQKGILNLLKKKGLKIKAIK